MVECTIQPDLCWPLFKEPVAFPTGLQAEAFWCGKHQAQGWIGLPCIKAPSAPGIERGAPNGPR